MILFRFGFPLLVFVIVLDFLSSALRIPQAIRCFVPLPVTIQIFTLHRVTLASSTDLDTAMYVHIHLFIDTKIRSPSPFDELTKSI